MTLPPILVTGGTGTLGQRVVLRLREAGHEVRVLSRRARSSQDGPVFVTGDLATGEGLPAAVSGVSTIVHCASNPQPGTGATLGRRSWPDFLAGKPAGEKPAGEKPTDERPTVG